MMVVINRVLAVRVSSNFNNKHRLSSVFGRNRVSTKNESMSNKNIGGRVCEDEIINNPCNIQMITEDLYQQVFIDRYRIKKYNDDVISKCKNHLEAHSLWGQNVPPSKPISFSLPPLQGIDIDDHFRNIARQQSFKYKALLDQLVILGIPKRPVNWAFKAGWTKYLPDGSSTPVPYPDENGFVFDVEVCQATGQVPTLACAVSTNAWYSWCSPLLVEEKIRNPSSQITVEELIPFETVQGESEPGCKKWTEKIIVGHNVSYDRARIKEQYFLEGTRLRFMDTMSMHIAISGITSFQRALKMTLKSGQKAVPVEKKKEMFNSEPSEMMGWNDISSLNNLADVYKLYCDGEIDKTERNIFVTGNISDVVQDFQNLMSYCCKDVVATHEILAQLLPKFYERFPHPVTLAGMLEMGSTYLPINSSWSRYMKNSEETFNRLEKEIKLVLMQKADEALELLPHEKYKKDPWLWNLDWKVSKVRSKKIPVVKSRKPIESCQNEDTKEVNQSKILSDEICVAKSYPAWYKKLLYKSTDINYTPGPAKISTSMQIVPKLLRLCWFGLPLFHSRKSGWGYLVKKPNDDLSTFSTKYVERWHQKSVDEDYSIEEEDNIDVKEDSNFPYEEWENIWEKNKAKLVKKLQQINGATNVELIKNEVRNKGEDVAQNLADFVKGLNLISDLRLSKQQKRSPSTVDVSPHPNCEFRPLPHKDGANYRVGNPLAKDFLNKIEEGILTCESGEDVTNKVVRVSKMVSYWRNNRDRILGQITVWLKKTDYILESKSSSNNDYEYGSILPQVSVSGTLTRRAVEPTWMTASNAYVDRVGSELKAMIQAPPSHHFVGSDVDSQELWIASVIGDAYFAGIHGCTALGWMTLQGNKTAGTDMHSKTASLIGIDRDQAKILNYGRIYGAGVNFAERLLTQFNHQMSVPEARAKARAMYKMTKGEKKYMLNEEGRKLAESIEECKEKSSKPFSKADFKRLMHHLHYPPMDYRDLIESTVWDDGTESHMFNRLEEIAQGESPQTPILKCCISRSLVPSVVQNDFMTSRVNWVVQSSAVDYLHLMLTSMRWLIEKYQIKARFSISVHDEVRYLVQSEDRYRAALALQITNFHTRALCSHQLGMYDLPQAVAFFSCVDIDKVLRKEVIQDCKTPSNPDGLTNGYGIPPGEALDIHEILRITKGSL